MTVPESDFLTDDSRASSLASGGTPTSPTKRKHQEHSLNHQKDSDEEQMNKMRCLLGSHLYVYLQCSKVSHVLNCLFSFLHHMFFLVLFFRRNSNADTGNQELWNYSHIVHNHRAFAPCPIFAVDQPLEMSEHSLDPTRSALLIPGSSTSRQQVRLIRSDAFMDNFVLSFVSTSVVSLILDVLLNVFQCIVNM